MNGEAVIWSEILRTPDTWWWMTIGALCGVACSLPGCFLVLRRLSLIGDAISHAVLPGLVLGLLVTGTRNPLPMFAGALVFGLLTAFLTELTHKIGRVPTDSSMGVVFTGLFALGVLLITRKASMIDIDPGCVLMGLIEFTVFDTIPVWGTEAPRAALSLGGVTLFVGAFVALLWKELKISAFDGALATTMGLSAGLMHYALMGVTALVTVASFEAAGAIMVIALLIVPGATAQLLTDRLGWMLAVSAAVAVVASALGTLAGIRLNTNLAGMIVVVLGVEFGLAALLAPRHGVLGRMFSQAMLGRRILCEDALALLWRLRERGAQPAMERRRLVGELGNGWLARWAVRTLLGRGWLNLDGDALALTDAGAAVATAHVRAHRLWETYLSEQMGSEAGNVHQRADAVEHFVTPEMADRLAAQLESPQQDPHGRRIPDPKESLTK
jgi:ABC-type Mn2+/Zn2+ transport system permease subunit/Mn-dependent DtxR family transcriptional regulator